MWNLAKELIGFVLIATLLLGAAAFAFGFISSSVTP